MAGFQGSTDFDGNETPVMEYQGRISSLDNKTLYGTPAPLAASTVLRTARRPDRGQHQREPGVLGSFIEDSNPQTGSLPGIEDISLVKMSYGSIEDLGPSTSAENRLELPPMTGNGELSVSGRSSFGLLPLDQMDDLSSSILHYKSSLEGAASNREHTDPATLVAHTGPTSQSMHSEAHTTKSTLQDTNIFPGSILTGLGAGVGASTGGGMPGLLLYGAGSEADQDASVHEVQFDQLELEQFDDEFSDLGDTMTEEPDGGQGSGGLFSQSHPPEMDFSALEADCDPGFDIIDVAEEERPEVAGQMSPVNVTSGQQGDGQEAECAAVRAGLDSMYLHHNVGRASGPGYHHQIGDGHDSEDQNVSDIFGNDAAEADLMPRRKANYRSNQLDTEIDTDDELAAARENAAREAFLLEQTGDCNDRPESERFSAEGHSLLHDPDLRQSAEGVDSGSPGDGSSGHNSDADIPQGAALAGQSAGRGCTRDVLAGLGLLTSGGAAPSGGGRYNPLEEDNPEAQQRIRPMGDDLLMGAPSQERHVRFASPAAERRSVASMEFREDDIMRAADILVDDAPMRPEDAQEESHLSMRFFTPSAALAASQTSEVSYAPGFDNSSFNLADLCKVTGSTGQNVMESASAEGFQMEDRDGTGVDDSVFRQTGDQGLDEPGNAEHGAGKNYLAEDSPVYINEEGEGVTDLAYHIPLEELGANPFDNSIGVAAADFGEFDIGAMPGSEEFMSGDECQALIDQEEKKFQQANIFMQDEVMDMLQSSQSTQPDSWTVNSHSTVDTPSWLTNGDPCLRISIGTLIGAKTEALGSLGGDSNAVRPTFGSEFTTPPHDRKPSALLDATLTSQPEADATQTVEEEEDAPLRGSGVGSDVDREGGNNDTTLVMDDLGPDATTEILPTETGSQISNQDLPRSVTPDTSVASDSEGSRPCSQLSSHSSDSSVSDNTGALSISTITDLISSASVESKSSNLAGLIMQMSQNKVRDKHRNTQGKLEKLAEEKENKRDGSRGRRAKEELGSQSKRESSAGKRTSTGPGSSSKTDNKTKVLGSSKQNVEGVRKPGTVRADSRTSTTSKQSTLRKPADGKSQKTGQPTAVRPSQSQSSQRASTGRASTATIPKPSGTRTSSQPGPDNRKPPAGPARVSGGLPKQADTRREAPARKAADQSRTQGSQDPRSSKRNPTTKTSGIPSSEALSSSSRASQRQGAKDTSAAPSQPKAARGTFSKIPTPSPPTGPQHAEQRSEPEQRQEADDRHEPGLPQEADISDMSFMRDLPQSSSSAQGRRKEETRRRSTQLRTCALVQNGSLDSEDTDLWGAPAQDGNFNSPRLSTAPSRSRHLLGSGEKSPINIEYDNIDDNLRDSSEFTPVKNRLESVTQKPSNEARPGENNMFYSPEDEQMSSKLGCKRMSSTPSGPVDDFTISATHSLSRISPSPRDRQVFIASADATLTSDKSDSSTPEAGWKVEMKPHINIQQSTPKPLKEKALFQSDRDQARNNGSQAASQYDQKHWSQAGSAPYERLGLVYTTAGMLHPPPDMGTSMSMLSEYPISPSESRIMPMSRGSPHSMGYNPHLVSTAPIMSSLPARPGVSLSSTAPPGEVGMCFDVAREVRLPEECCVGLSVQGSLTIRNTCSKWLQVVLHMVAVMVDGQPQNLSQVWPFILKEKVFLEPHTAEDVQVLFAPRQAGVYIGQLHLVANPVGSETLPTVQRVPAMVTLQAVASLPSVEVLAGQSNMLDFGALPWNRQKGLPILLYNKSRCAVPIRLRIAFSQVNALNCFTFEKYSGDVSVISQHSRPKVPSLAPSIINLTLPPQRDTDPSQPVPAVISFKAACRQFEKTSMNGPPEEFTARVEVEVDTPSSLLPLATVPLRAAVGISRLHTPKDMEDVHLAAEVGQTETMEIPLRNVGNIPLDLSFEITHWPDLFSVTPSDLTIPARGQRTITISFRPTESSTAKFESLLLVRLEPEGPDFEIDLNGRLVEPPPPVSTQRDTPQLMANKQTLVFGGVGLGKSAQQSTSLKSIATEMVKIQLKISDQCGDFHLLTNYGSSDQISATKEVILRPQEVYVIHVLFSPTRAMGMDSKLHIYSSHSHSKFTIPLSGYGGVSQLELQGVKTGQKGNYWSDIGPIFPNHSKTCQFIMVNKGVRAAFVKAVPFRDLGLKVPMPTANMVLKPNEFCIKPQETMALTVNLFPGEKEASLCDQVASVVGVFAIFFGDEVCRQKMRKALHKTGPQNCGLYETEPVRGIDFDVPYINESLVIEGEDIRSTKRDMDLFYSSMSKVTFSLVGQPIVFATPKNSMLKVRSAGVGSVVAPTGATWEIMNEDNNGPISTLHAPPEVERLGAPQYMRRAGSLPVEGSPAPHKECLQLNNLGSASRRSLPTTSQHTDDQSWSIKPDQLILEVPGKDTGVLTRRVVQIINFKEVAVSFEVSTPSYVVIYPEKGTIKAMSTAVLSVSASHKVNDEAIVLPYRGNVLITCSDQQKILPVQIRRDMVLEQSALLSVDCHSPQPLSSHTPLITVATPAQKRAERLSVAHQELDFPVTTSMQTSQMSLEVTNIQPFPIKWSVSSIAPPYLKVGDKDKNLYRVTYSAFYISTHSGVLHAQEDTQVQVFFRPQESGSYSQGWEIKSQSLGDGPGMSHCCQLNLTGQSVEQEVSADTGVGLAGTGLSLASCATSGQLTSALDSLAAARPRLPSDAPTHSHRARSERDRKPVIVVKPESMVFPATSLQDTYLSKLELKNKDVQPHEVRIVRVDPPFHIKHTKVIIKNQRYVRLPVEFRPQHPGHFQGLLLLEVDTGIVITVMLTGTA